VGQFDLPKIGTGGLTCRQVSQSGWSLATSLPWRARLDQSQILRHNSRGVHLCSASTRTPGPLPEGLHCSLIRRDSTSIHPSRPVCGTAAWSSLTSRCLDFVVYQGFPYWDIKISSSRLVSIVSVFRINDFFVQLVQPEAPS